MKYSVSNNEIFIPNCKDFSAKQTLECGQVFRFKETTLGYEVYSLNHKATLICQKDGTKIFCDDVNYFINYFDLLTDYAKIKQELNSISTSMICNYIQKIMQVLLTLSMQVVCLP